MANGLTIERLWIAVVALLLVVVALSLASAGLGPLAALGAGGAWLIKPLFLVGSLTAGYASYRQFSAEPGGRPTPARRMIGVAIGFVGLACWALFAFALIVGLQTQLARP